MSQTNIDIFFYSIKKTHQDKDCSSFLSKLTENTWMIPDVDVLSLERGNPRGEQKQTFTISIK